MRAKEYEVMERAVSDGAIYGVRRYFKYRDVPYPNESAIEEMASTVAEHVMNSINEWFDFKEEEAP